MQHDSSSIRAVENRMATRRRRACHSNHTLYFYMLRIFWKKNHILIIYGVKLCHNIANIILLAYSFPFILQFHSSRIKLCETVEERQMMSSIDQRFMSDLEEGPFSWSDSQPGYHRSWRIRWPSLTNELQTKWLRLQLLLKLMMLNQCPLLLLAKKGNLDHLRIGNHPGDWPLARSGPVNLPHPHLPQNTGEGWEK